MPCRVCGADNWIGNHDKCDEHIRNRSPFLSRWDPAPPGLSDEALPLSVIDILIDREWRPALNALTDLLLCSRWWAAELIRRANSNGYPMPSLNLDGGFSE